MINFGCHKQQKRQTVCIRFEDMCDVVHKWWWVECECTRGKQKKKKNEEDEDNTVQFCQTIVCIYNIIAVVAVSLLVVVKTVLCVTLCIGYVWKRPTSLTEKKRNIHTQAQPFAVFYFSFLFLFIPRILVWFRVHTEYVTF